MKKTVAVIVAVVLIVGVSVFFLTHKNKTNASNSSTNTSTVSTNYAAVAACSVLTSSIANQILGSSAVKATPPADTESTSDIAFSECIYSAGPTVDPPHMASVAIRSAKDSTGAASNSSVFTSAGMPSGAQTVTGYGDKAYWDPSMGQLNILKGSNWYILNNYTGTSPTNGTATLAMSEQLAQAIKL